MADSKSKPLHCRIHDQESYKYYCKQCKECICLQCIEELHVDHTFCRLKSVEYDIRKELENLVQVSEEEENENTSCVQHLIEEKLINLGMYKLELTKQIEDAADKITLTVNESKQKSLSVLDDIFVEITSTINAHKLKYETFCTNMTEKDITNMDLNDVIENLMEMKSMMFKLKDFLARNKKPIFTANKPNFSIGQFECRMSPTDQLLMKNENEASNLKEIRQTPRLDDNSSDILQEAYPRIISSDTLRNVDKIVPISQNDAWILTGKLLRKITSNNVENAVYCYSVDDFALLSDGSVLVTEIRSSVIRRRLNDGRIVIFVDVGSHSANFPSCISVANKSVIVGVCIIFKRDLSDECKVVRFDTYSIEGIRISSTNMTEPAHLIIGRPYRNIFSHKVASDTMHYLICDKYSYGENHAVVLLNETNPKKEISKYFQGVFGANPSKTFKCAGACVDAENNILVSDWYYKCVYALNKDLKFKSVVIKNVDFDLKCPGAVVVSDGVMWVSDEKKMYRFKYDSKSNKLI